MPFFLKNELKTLGAFYLDALISPILFFAPVFYVLFWRQLDFSLFQVGLLVSASALAGLLFEIPTGAVADLYGRKFSVLLGTALLIVANLSLYFLKDFWIIYAAFLFLGFSATFISGAREAWVTDLIGKDKKLVHRYFSRIASVDNIGLFVSGFLGAFLVARFGVPVIWIASSASFLVSLALLSFAPERRVRRRAPRFRESLMRVAKQSREALAYARHHHILYLFLVAAVFFGLAAELNGPISLIPLFQELAMPEYAFGYLWSAMAAIGIIAPLLTNRFYAKGKERTFIIGILIFWILFAFCYLFVQSLSLAIFLLLAVHFMDQSKRPADRILFQRYLPTRMRATLGSVEGMLLNIVWIITTPLAGLLVDSVGPRITLALSAALMVPALVSYVLIDEQRKPTKRL